MSESGEARNHETVKAIADVLARYVTGTVDVGLLDIARVIAALDAVRCAQGRDTDAPERHEILSKACAEGTCGCKAREGIASEGGTANPRDLATAAPSLAPQGEDHEVAWRVVASMSSDAYAVLKPVICALGGQIESAGVGGWLGRATEQSEPSSLGELLDGETK